MNTNSISTSTFASALITSMHSFIFGMNLAIFSTYKEIYVSKKGVAPFLMSETEFKHAICVICLGALTSNLTASGLNI